MGLSFDDEDSFKEGVGSLNFYNPPSHPNTPVLGSSGTIPLQEMNEDHDVCFNNPPTDDPNSLQVRRVESCSSNNTPPEERIEVIYKDIDILASSDLKLCQWLIQCYSFTRYHSLGFSGCARRGINGPQTLKMAAIKHHD